MALIAIAAGGTQAINSSETDTVAFAGAGTLNVAGTTAAPINVVLSQVGGVGLLDTINVSNATVTLGGVAGVSALVDYRIGAGGRLNLASTVGVTAGTSVTFTAPGSILALGAGINVALLSGIAGFAPGSAIDVSQLASSVTYADAPGTNTGGIITLRDGAGNPVGTLPLTTGDFSTASFQVTPDGVGGTLVSFPTTVTGITATPATADLGAGQTATITLTPSDAVTVAGGTPTLALNDGGVATYVPGASTGTSLVFTTTVLPGQNTADLAVTGVSLNGATVNNAVGVPANLAGAVANPAGVLQVDTTAPTIAGVGVVPGSGAVGAGTPVTITLTPSEAVTVAGGTPTLALNDGGVATYVPGASTPTSLVFTTTTAAGQNTPGLAITGASLNGATIVDGAGNGVDLTAAVATLPLAVDTTRPTVAGVTTNPGSGAVGAGGTVTLTVATSEPVAVAGGTPTLGLSNGGTATYVPGASTPTGLVFTTTVAAGQTAADLAVTGLNPNGAAITDAAGNTLDPAGAAVNPPGVLAIDTTAPTITGVTTTPGSGTVGPGATITLTVATSEPVAVAGGTPTLGLSNGGTATYVPGASTPTGLVFTTTVGAGQTAADLTVTGLNPNGATIRDPAGNGLVLGGAVVNPPGVLAIDTTAPIVTGVTTNPGSGTIGAGGTVTLTVGTSEPVAVTGGTPTLSLNDGGTATFVPGASTPTGLVFTTTVAPGQSAADLAVTGLNPNGATIKDAAGNALVPGGAVVNPAGVLVIDGVAPGVAGVTTSPASGTLTTGQTLPITVTTTEPVVVTGTPTLSLNNGGTATYDPASSTPTGLVFGYTPTAGQDTGDLAVTGLNLNGGTIQDAAGNNAGLAAAATNPPGVLAVDTNYHPFAPLVASNPDATVAVTVVASTRPAVTGTYANLGTGTLGADGTTYTVTGTVAQVNAALAGVTLVPASGAPVVTGLTASISDGSTQVSRLTNTSVQASALTAATASDVVVAGSGADTLLGGAAGTTLIGGAGADVLVGSSGGGMLLGGAGSSSFITQGGNTTVVGAGAKDVISAALGNATVISAVGGRTVIGLGAGASLVNGQGADTLIAGSGSLVTGVATGSTVFLAGGSAIVSAAQGTTVVGGAGADTIGVRGSGILFFDGPGATTFIGGSGASTVVGGTAGNATVFAGAGGGLLNGGSGGNNLIVGGLQATTILGGGSGDMLFAQGSAGTVIRAGSGNETLQGIGSSGNDTFFAGSGTNLIGLGSGQDAVFAGSGNATVVAGTGRDVFAVTKGSAGGTLSIIGFKSGVDVLSLQGFADGEVQRAAASVTVSAGGGTQPPSATIRLSDNTQVSFLGVGGLPPGTFG